MISSITTLLALIKSMPQIIEALFEIKKMWDTYLEQDKRREAIQMFGDAINVARTQRDTTKLTDLVNRIINCQPLK